MGWNIGDAQQPTPLVTAGSLTAPLPGALGQPGTSVQIGGTSVSLPMELGGRFALGTWIDRAAGLGIELGAFVLSPDTTRQSVATNGMPGSATYAVPLFDLSGFTSGGAPGQSIYVLPGPFPSGPGFTGAMQRTMSAQMVGAELVGLSAARRPPDEGRSARRLSLAATERRIGVRRPDRGRRRIVQRRADVWFP